MKLIRSSVCSANSHRTVTLDRSVMPFRSNKSAPDIRAVYFHRFESPAYKNQCVIVQVQHSTGQAGFSVSTCSGT